MFVGKREITYGESPLREAIWGWGSGVSTYLLTAHHTRLFLNHGPVIVCNLKRNLHKNTSLLCAINSAIFILLFYLHF